MEEEVNYSTVVFDNRDQTSGEKEDSCTVYAVVKKKEAAAVSNDEAVAHSHFTASSVCLGILCFLLVMSISAIIYISVLMDRQKSNLKDLETKNHKLITEKSVIREEKEQLITEKSILQKETERMSRVAENANHTMEVILKFKNFPVNEFCPEKKCKPCRKGWISFQEKCYLFYNRADPWKTWQQSREYCQNATADLVVVNSPQEQEFISEHIKSYHDEYHGYWLGLQESDKTWHWVDGSNDSLKYWMTLGSSGLCGLMIPERNLTASWDPAWCGFKNKFICESEVLIKLD